MTHHIIVGAGVSGLALGWYLKKQNEQVTILEADDRVGGWIRSHREQGFLFEQGPRSCRSRSAGLETLRLIEDLDLCDEVISASPAAKKRFIYWEGKLQAVPCSFGLMKEMLPALWKEWRVPPSCLEDESIADFIGRRLNHTIAAKLMDPLVSGIYAGDISRLSFRSCFPEMHRMEQEHGSLLRGMLRKKRTVEDVSPFVQAMRKNSIFSFVNGMETLVSALYSKLENAVRLSSRVTALNISHDVAEAVLSDGQIVKGDRVYLAIPAYAAASLLDTRISEEMMKIPYASVAAVNMGWNQKVLKQEGFGYLVPSSQKQEVLGVVFDSSAFAQQNQHDHETRLTVMLGGMHHPWIEKASKEKIHAKAFRALHTHLGITEKPEAIHITVARQAIPQYEVGHEARLQRIEEALRHTPIILLGNAWRGVSVNDCIAEAKIKAKG
jgi:protoporphyrinogen/coproporphyrinogen III oxidase